MRRGLLFVAVLSWACADANGDEAAPATPAPEPSASPEPSEPTEPTEPVDTGPDAVQCGAFVDHMAVVVAQHYGAPAAGLFTDAERERAVEHCQRYAHPHLLECGGQAQVWSYYGNCLDARAVPRPRLQTPSREVCGRLRDRVFSIQSALQNKAGGYATPTTERGRERGIDACVDTLTVELVQCAIESRSQLDLVSCFSPYDVGTKRSWPSAEDCEAYADHMVELREAYQRMPYVKPVEVTDALTSSRLLSSMVPGVRRPQLVNLCHAFDREMVQCHMSAQAVVELGDCVP